MLSSNNIQSIIGATVFGPDDVKLGRVDQVFVDAADGHPTWAEVNIGGLGHHTRFVPLQHAAWENDDVHVPYDKDLVKDAPKIDGEDGLSPEQERELSRHYAGGADARDEDAREDDHRTAGPRADADSADDADERTSDATAPNRYLDDDGVLWEERVVVSKEQVPVARVHVESLTNAEVDETLTDARRDDVRDETGVRDDRGIGDETARGGRDDPYASSP